MFDLIIRNITQRKFRTGLTVFGIALGIFAVMVMGGMSEYFNRHSENTLNLVDKIQVVPETGYLGGSIDESTVRKVNRVPGVFDAYGLLWMPYDVEGIGLIGDYVVGIPIDKQGPTLKDTKLKSGRLLLPGDTYRAVLGSNVEREFKIKVGDELPIKSKRYRGTSSITHERNFTVVGILEYTSSDYDNVIAIPLETAQKFYELENTVSYIWVVPEPSADGEDLAKRIELSVEKITALSPQKLREQVEKTLVVINLITLSSAILAAIIGGLSVMNTMFMSVSERTRDFGLMKAMGAQFRDILFLTMGESALMGVLGGIFGIIGGGIFIYSMNEYLSSMGMVLFAITPRLIIISLLFATLLGTLSGSIPAYRAMKMNPMEAMKYG
ncbi:Macrolide export ATP-binding/permease protein MacB [Methanosarcinales archaeon]|nr:Macrolide export ATP-binding/permease protein MacB [Methanosarcinales archaeon]